MREKSLYEQIEYQLVDVIYRFLSGGDIYVERDTIQIEIPQDRKFGHLSTNVAMILSKRLNKEPMKFADEIRDAISEEIDFCEIEVVKPGFINFTISDEVLVEIIEEIWSAGKDYAKSSSGNQRKVQVEFVSANPTGPLNVVNGRAGALGETVVRSLRWVGYEVDSEYYVNDMGRQVDILGDSIITSITTKKSDREEKLPEDGYKGEYVDRLAEQLKSENISDEELISRKAVDRVLSWHREVMEEYGVEYDLWFRQSDLDDDKLKEEMMNRLNEREAIYEEDDALWFKATKYGDEQDWVLIKRDGEGTYLFYDLLYHLNKYERGYEKVIDIWGPDHHGHIGRMEAGIRALGIVEDWLEILIAQQVNILKDGERVKMSKREGSFIQLDELIEEVGVDASKYFFLDRSPSSHLDFDFDIAREQSLENPVYYIQYAHARICSIFRESEKPGYEGGCDYSDYEFNQDEMDIIFKLFYLPRIIKIVARSYQTQLLCDYLYDLSNLFHKYYTNYRILGEKEEVTQGRLSLIGAVRTVLWIGLYLLGIEAPERM